MTERFANFRTDPGVLRGIPGKDLFLALALGMTAAVWAVCGSAPGIPPELWEATASAVGLRPPESPSPGIWRLGTVVLTKLAGISAALGLLRLLGVVAAASFGFLGYLTVRDFQDCAAEPHVTHPSWRGWVPRVVSVLPVLLLVTCAPMGRLVRFFGPETLLMLMTASSLFLMQRFLRSGRIWALYVSVGLAGAVLVETPLGLPLVGFLLVKIVVFSARPYNPDLPLCQPVLYLNLRWQISGLFLGSVLTAALVDAWAFWLFEGWEACGWRSLSDAAVGSCVGYAQILSASAGFSGWCSGLAVCCVPYVVVRRLFACCVQVERPLPYLPGLACLGMILVSYVQFANAPVFWFWSRAESGSALASPMLIVLFLYFSVLALMLAMSVWAADLFCRSSRVVWLFNTPEDLTAIDGNPRYRQFADFLRRKAHWSRRIVPGLLLVLMVCGALPFARETAFRAAATLVDEAVKASVGELEGVRWIFTDGRMDAALELESAVRGRRLTALSMIAPRGPRTEYLNLRDPAEETDELLMKGSAAETLRSWILSDRPQLSDSALQLGVEMFARARMPAPTYLGLCARPKASEDGTVWAREASEDLERRVLAYYDRYGEVVTTDGLTSQLLNTFQWRLGRILRFRAAEARRGGRPDEAVLLEGRADALDERNAELKSLMHRLDWFSAQKGDTLTPREGLRVALARPDFKLACRYAAPILHSEPDDPDANFAMAMRYLIEKNWESSEMHFRKVLEVRPNEVAILNNLAIVCFQRGRVDEALRLANQAKKLAPASDAVADTLRTILKAEKKDN